MGGAIYVSGEDWWEGGVPGVGDGNWTRSSRCSDSKVKEVTVSYSFPASPVRPVNATLWAGKTRLSTVS